MNHAAHTLAPRLPLAAACMLGALSLTTPGSSARAQSISPPLLVADLVTAVSSNGSFPNAMVKLGDLAFFSADDGRSGREIWRTDGTPAGTAMLVDLCPGSCSFNGALTVVGDRLFALGNEGSGLALFVSDGTASGTRFVRRFPDASPYVRGVPVAFGDRLWFILSMARPGQGFIDRLWESDGTAAGTAAVVLAGDDACDSEPQLLGVAGDALYLVSCDPLHNSSGLWRVEAQPSGPTLFTNLCPQRCPTITGGTTVVSVGRQLYFAGADSEHGHEVWTIGAGEPAPRLVEDLMPGPDSSHPALPLAFDGAAYFFSFAPSSFGVRSWYRTRGSGLEPASELQPYGAGFVPTILFPAGDHLFFPIYSGAQTELWGSGAAGAPSRRLDHVNADSFQYLGSLGGQALFFAVVGSETQLWTSDGTPEGTRSLGGVPFRPGYLPRGSAPEVGGGLLLPVAGQNTGFEPWLTDGTLAGTRPLGDLNHEASSWPDHLTALGSALYFSAGRRNAGDLWRASATGGTPAVTNTDVIAAADVAAAGGHLFAVRYDDPALLSVDPLAGSTPLLRGSAPFHLTAWGNQLAFGGGAGEGQGVWVSDGSAAGTRMVFDPLPEWSPHCGPFECGGPIYPLGLTPVGPLLYFIASEGEDHYGDELWRTDGTAAGTVGLLPASAVADYRQVESMVPFGAGVALVTNGVQGDLPPPPHDTLWLSAGTVESTRALIDTHDSVSLLGASGSRLLFARRPNGSDDDELWASDGTSAGTVLVSRLAGGGTGTRITSDSVMPLSDQFPPVERSVIAGGRLFFTVADAVAGEELWLSDGSNAGTRRVADLVPGPRGSHPTGLSPHGACVLFAATDGVHGDELWASNGVNTWLVADLAAGTASSSPGTVTAAGGFLYFAADDGTHGRELFAVPASAFTARCASVPLLDPPPPAGDWLASAAVPGFRFKVLFGQGTSAHLGSLVPCVAGTLCVVETPGDRRELMVRL
ncbi:MAG TPA: hypothetical protein VGV61_17410, partial [Thermoanaerobaculia bacterium]|nr:hypothetical protein [Thermoanaerobaculia bacterium]